MEIDYYGSEDQRQGEGADRVLVNGNDKRDKPLSDTKATSDFVHTAGVVTQSNHSLGSFYI